MYGTGSSKLAYTGLGTLSVGGIMINQLWLVAGSLALVGIGALMVRWAWRRKKSSQS
jgi:hypothetical protein